MIESTTIIPNKPETDIISPKGDPVASEAGASLAKIFDLADQGTPIKEAISQVNDAPAEKKVEEKKQGNP